MSVTHPQPNQRGDPDCCRSRFEGSVVAPAVPSKGAGWSQMLLTSVQTLERDTHHNNHQLQKCCTKFAHLVRGPRCGFIQASLRVMKYRHSARIAVCLEVQSSALQRAPRVLSTQSNEERAAAPAQRIVEQINLDDSTSGEKRHVQDLSAVASAGSSRHNIAKDIVRLVTVVRMEIQDESCACRRCKRRTDSDYCCKKSHQSLLHMTLNGDDKMLCRSACQIRTLNVCFATCVDRSALVLHPISVRLEVQRRCSREMTMVTSLCTWIVPPSRELQPRIQRSSDRQIHSLAAMTRAAIKTE